MNVRNAKPYFLPAGLPDGTSVKVIAFRTGYGEVEYWGKQFTISMVCIDQPLVKARD
ncbi:MAG: hypothetical protein O2960_21360 [Verrucomicrobia bacterium]|nr:hypothetical protein [Verrucomicrobiota bacterium]